MSTPAVPSHRHGLSLPDEPGRRAATLSLLMVPTSVVAALVAGAVGTFLQFVVFDLAEQELLSDAGVWGTVAGLLLLVPMVVPGLAGMLFGARARRLGERRRGLIGIVLNAAIAAYVVVAGLAFLIG